MELQYDIDNFDFAMNPRPSLVSNHIANVIVSRYKCEGRSAGALLGECSSGDNKLFPTIQVVGYTGPAFCVVSLLENTNPYRAHPHNLVGRDGEWKMSSSRRK